MASGPTWRAGPPRSYNVALRPRGRTRVAHAWRVIRSPIYAQTSPRFSPCGTMFHTVSYVAGDVAAWRASDWIRAAEIKPRGSQAGDQ